MYSKLYMTEKELLWEYLTGAAKPVLASQRKPRGTEVQAEV